MFHLVVQYEAWRWLKKCAYYYIIIKGEEKEKGEDFVKGTEEFT